MGRIGLAMTATAFAVLAAVPAAADFEQDRRDCTARRIDPEAKAKACTALILMRRFDEKNLAAIYYHRADAFRRMRHYDRAIGDYDQAIRFNPNDAEAFNNRANAHADKGEHGRAIADYGRAIALNPKYATAFANRGLAYQHLRRYGEAVADFDRALHLNPGFAEAMNAKAWLLATAPEDRARDGAEAVRLARRALARRDGANARDTLAAALAEAGDFAAAAAEQERAIIFARAEGRGDLKEFEDRLGLYRARKPYRDK